METTHKASVLVIDDEPELRDRLAAGLEKRGYRVVCAASLEAALKRLQEEAFELAVCDMAMAGKDKTAFLHRLREASPATEVVMAAGAPSIESAIASLKEGTCDFVTRPYELPQISSLFDRALERRALRARVDHLEDLHRLKDEFLAAISHELRTPITVALGYAALLQDHVYGALSPDQAKAVGTIIDRNKELLRLLNNMIDLAKLLAGQMPVSRQRCVLADVAKEAQEALAGPAAEKGLALKWDVAPELVAETDRAKLRQILLHLAGNSLKFTQEGEVAVSIAPEGDAHFRMVVRDTGIGIPPEQMALLFQEFRQLDGSLSRRYGGTGIGLSISRRLAELLGGRIKAESTPGRGSIFTVVLPRRLPGPDVAGHVPPAETSHPILLAIEEDPEIQLQIASALESTYYTFAGAAGAAEGLELARRLHPAVIILDVTLPDGAGWEALRRLKEDPRLHSIPVLILCARGEKGAGFSLEVHDCVTKPLRPEEFAEKLARTGGRPAARKILVVDDDASFTRLFKSVLEREGYEVETAGGGIEAMTRMTARRPDVVLLDLMMPDMSGIEVLEAMGRDPALGRIRVIVMTAKDLLPEEMRRLEQRVELILQKGSRDLPEILALINKRLRTFSPSF